MSDARMPERYLNDRRMNRLSDGAFRAYVSAMMWSVSNRTDGIIQPEDQPLIRNFSSSAVAEMIATELLIRNEDSWMLADYSTTQTTRSEFEVLENARKRDREKKQRQRAAGKSSTPVFSSPVPGDVSGDESPGQHRQGKAGIRAPVKSQDVEGWPTVEIPKSKEHAA